MSGVECKKKLDRQHTLPISRQCSVLDISPSSAYRKPSGVNAEDVGLMRLMGIRALHPGAKTTRPNPQHKVYPYLLRDLAFDRANQV